MTIRPDLVSSKANSYHSLFSYDHERARIGFNRIFLYANQANAWFSLIAKHLSQGSSSKIPDNREYRHLQVAAEVEYFVKKLL